MSRQSWWKETSASRRDVRASKDGPETSTSARQKKSRKRPWVLEYRFPAEVRSEHATMWSMWKKDSQWHKYMSRYADARAASNAMTTEKSKWERDRFERTMGIEWRIRNTEDKNEGVRSVL